MHAEIESTCESSPCVHCATIHVLIWANEALVAGMNEESYHVASCFLLSFSLAAFSRRSRSSVPLFAESES